MQQPPWHPPPPPPEGHWPGQPPSPQLSPPPGPYPYQQYPQQVILQVGTDGLAIASGIIGIASWLICPGIGALIAILTGHIALSGLKHNQRPGRGWALTGLILGYAHLAIFALALLIFFSVCGGLAILGGTLAQPTP